VRWRRCCDAAAKQDARDAVEAQALAIGSQLSQLAAKTNDAMLAANVACDKSTLDKAPISDLLVTANKISKAAADNSAVLASDYLIDAAELAAFSAAITKLDGMKTAPQVAVADRKVAGMSLADGIVFVRAIYRNELDKLMEKFKKTQPDFYGAYFAARVIIDRTGTHAAPAKPVTPPVVPPTP